jgi:hypothetical protein
VEILGILPPAPNATTFIGNVDSKNQIEEDGKRQLQLKQI